MKQGNSTSKASSNWLELRKQLNSGKRKKQSTPQDGGPARKKRKTDPTSTSINGQLQSSSTKQKFVPIELARKAKLSSVQENAATEAPSELQVSLQKMVLGELEFSDAQKTPGRYLAMDCEMVGIGLDGSESSLARVSLVNFHGAIVLDEFVKQKERVVDYRTQWSGIRETDMINAKPFEDIQQQVATLLQDKILIGHAVHNDLKALLLSHPRPMTRDTQFYAHKFKLCKTNRIALRNLVKQEIGMTIQEGEHSSVTDARATMAVYRLHKKEWEKGSRKVAKHSVVTEGVPPTNSTDSKKKTRKRKEREEDSVEVMADSDSSSELSKDEVDNEGPKLTPKRLPPPGGGRRGVSSGLSTVVRRAGEVAVKGKGGLLRKAKTDWWKTLPGASGSKGSITIPPKT